MTPIMWEDTVFRTNISQFHSKREHDGSRLRLSHPCALPACTSTSFLHIFFWYSPSFLLKFNFYPYPICCRSTVDKPLIPLYSLTISLEYTMVSSYCDVCDISGEFKTLKTLWIFFCNFLTLFFFLFFVPFRQKKIASLLFEYSFFRMQFLVLLHFHTSSISRIHHWFYVMISTPVEVFEEDEITTSR